MGRLELLSLRWGEISALLDEALALPAGERDRWLQALPAAQSSLQNTLRELLASQAGVETGDFLRTLPRLAAGPAAVADEPVAGLRVGPYRLLSLLGQGGMGSVWLAERADGQLKRSVALKLPRMAWGSAVAERLARERDILASLEHPYIARLYDAGVDAHGRPYFAMEWVQGQPIDVWCRERALPPAARITLLLQVCEAVAHAHARLVVHRDLKPGNILVTEQAQVRLLDFGIAKLMEGDRTEATALTRQAGHALTLDYASPEQIAGAPLGTASDVYSLGVVAFELLAGARPYRLKRGSAAELEEAIASAEPPRASDVAAGAVQQRALRGDLDAILDKALKKQPEQRYRGVIEFADDLRRHLHGEPVLARPVSRMYRLCKFVGRNGLAVGATAAVAATLVVAATVSLWQARVAQRQAQRALAVQEFMTDIFRTNSINQADPLKARQTSAREVLDIGAQRIDRHLQADPEGRAEVLGLFSDMYFDLGLDPEAADFDGRRAQALKQAFGPQDPRVASALAQYAKRLDASGRVDEQRRALDEARAILDARDDHQSEARAQWLEAMAKADPMAGKKTLAWAEEAVAIYRRHHPQSKSLSGALNRLGIARTQVDDLAGAEAAFVESLERLQQDPQANVSLLVTGNLMIAGAQAQAAQDHRRRRDLSTHARIDTAAQRRAACGHAVRAGLVRLVPAPHFAPRRGLVAAAGGGPGVDPGQLPAVYQQQRQGESALCTCRRGPLRRSRAAARHADRSLSEDRRRQELAGRQLPAPAGAAAAGTGSRVGGGTITGRGVAAP